MRRRPALGTTLLTFALAALPAGAEIRTGEWENHVTVETHMMPANPIQRTSRYCVTPADVERYADPEAWAQPMLDAMREAQCTVREKQLEGNVFTMTLDCENESQMKVRQEMGETSGTSDHEMWAQGMKISTTHGEMKHVADTCGPAAVEEWKRQHPGEPYAP